MTPRRIEGDPAARDETAEQVSLRVEKVDVRTTVCARNLRIPSPKDLLERGAVAAQRGAVTAEWHGLTRAALADELCWTISHLSELLGQTDPRPDCGWKGVGDATPSPCAGKSAFKYEGADQTDVIAPEPVGRAAIGLRCRDNTGT